MFPLDSKILIVDDSSFSRTVLKNGLKEIGFLKIIEAESAKVAKNILFEKEQLESPIRLLFVDLHMPEVSGLELIQWVRHQNETEGLPVIMLTTVQEKGFILEAGKLGVSHYMIKPFELEGLKQRLTSTWEKHGRAYYEHHNGKAS